nr:unnamed protein product [Callosobruchus chinensis]
MTSCYYMDRALPLRHCVCQAKQVLQLLNYAHIH